jgi:hypothetical protein
VGLLRLSRLEAVETDEEVLSPKDIGFRGPITAEGRQGIQ